MERVLIKNWFVEHSDDGTVVDYMEDTLQDFLRYELASKDELKEEMEHLDKLIEESGEFGRQQGTVLLCLSPCVCENGDRHKRTVPIFRAWENRRLYPGGKDDIIVKISRTAK